MTQSAGDHDIKVNVIAPNVWTRMAGDPSEGMDQLRAARPAGPPPHLEPELVAPTIEDVAANWAAINDEAGYYVPTSTLSWSARYMSHRF